MPPEAVISLLAVTSAGLLLWVAVLSSRLKKADQIWEDAFDTGITFGMVAAADVNPLDSVYDFLIESDEHDEDDEIERLYGHYSPVYPSDSL